MKHYITLSLVLASVIFSGCDEKSKGQIEETKEAAVQTVEKAKEVVKTSTEKTQEIAQKVKEGAEKAAGSVAEKVDSALYGKCIACHGIDGKTKALGKSAVLAGQSQDTLVTKLKGYKAGTLNVSGMGMMMQGQVKNMSDVEIEAVAAYIATFK